MVSCVTSARRVLYELLSLQESCLHTFKGICEAFPSLPPPPSTPPSLALSDSVLIAAIKLPHLVREEILIFIRLREELNFFSALPSPPLSPLIELSGCSTSWEAL